MRQQQMAFHSLSTTMKAQAQRRVLDKQAILEIFAENLAQKHHQTKDFYLENLILLDQLVQQDKQFPWQEVAQQLDLDRWRLYHWYFETFQRMLAGSIDKTDLDIMREMIKTSLLNDEPLDKQFQQRIKSKMIRQYHRSSFSIAFNNVKRQIMKELGKSDVPTNRLGIANMGERNYIENQKKLICEQQNIINQARLLQSQKNNYQQINNYQQQPNIHQQNNISNYELFPVITSQNIQSSGEQRQLTNFGTAQSTENVIFDVNIKKIQQQNTGQTVQVLNPITVQNQDQKNSEQQNQEAIVPSKKINLTQLLQKGKKQSQPAPRKRKVKKEYSYSEDDSEDSQSKSPMKNELKELPLPSAISEQICNIVPHRIENPIVSDIQIIQNVQEIGPQVLQNTANETVKTISQETQSGESQKDSLQIKTNADANLELNEQQEIKFKSSPIIKPQVLQQNNDDVINENFGNVNQTNNHMNNNDLIILSGTNDVIQQQQITILPVKPIKSYPKNKDGTFAKTKNVPVSSQIIQTMAISNRNVFQSNELMPDLFMSTLTEEESEFTDFAERSIILTPYQRIYDQQHVVPMSDESTISTNFERNRDVGKGLLIANQVRISDVK